MKAYLVGGAVRDRLLGRPVAERDFVVVGALPEELLALGYRQVGKDFPVFLHPDRQNDTELKDRIIGMAHRVGAIIFARQQHAIMNRRDSVPLLSQITCPTIVVCGDEDRLTPPECSKEMAEGIPGSALHFVENCGHLSTMERPEEVARIMREWLGRCGN